MPPRRAIFLDRDGVLNASVVREGKPYPPAHVDEVVILPGVAQALARLNTAGYMLIVVSNQPDVARGSTTREEVEAINDAVNDAVNEAVNGQGRGSLIDQFRMCYHDGPDDCHCRKPRPGMLTDAAREHGLDLASCYMVGDRWRDVEAGQRAGCATVFIDYGYDEKQPERCDIRAASLAEATDLILGPPRVTAASNLKS